MLFINADARVHARAGPRTSSGPSTIEKIVSTFRAFEDVPGFATVVTAAELAENDYNFNIRRYADNAPPPEPHDVRAHLHGGIPKAEVESARIDFVAYGVDLDSLFSPRGNAYVDLLPPDHVHEVIREGTSIARSVGVRATGPRLEQGRVRPQGGGRVGQPRGST